MCASILSPHDRLRAKVKTALGRQTSEAMAQLKKEQRAKSRKREKDPFMTYRPKNSEIMDFNKLNNEMDELSRLKQLERNLTNKLQILTNEFTTEDQKRKALEDNLSKTRTKIGTNYTQTRESEQLINQIKAMESRLEKSTIKYNQNLVILAEKREQLDILRKANMAPYQTDKKQPNSPQKTSHENNRTLAQQKEDIQAEIDKLNSNNKEVTEEYSKKIDELTEEANSELESQSKQQKNQKVDHKTDNLTAQTEEYQDRISQTLKLLNLKSVDEVIAEADRLERENCSLYNFVIEHSQNRKKLQEEVEALELQQAKILSQEGENKEIEIANSDLNEINQQISDAQKEYDELKKQCDAEEAKYSDIYKEIDELFNMLGCSWDGSPDDLSTVTPSNAMFALTCIENAIENHSQDKIIE
ncbi:hypothetical protein TVAG_238220 [Trichomonas vaginalis G3]|uniref:ODAD1 central coiled coil region domain-containing protein n=1 Tax=Trichomonas vaginalis (strain ATCC PRA-98 / G3) TaxID=412133 RepID=A2DD22_TRIV3|nr:coiled-coil domain-containing protein 63 family [Trichomonas vaginalis G3]EAY21796.1 hypothetical protein TVAG_238220 [Trichomonas vaginalis G3]KAI5524248.1 coiled-coil domain-containing protein 63 family [Trichomonas vaginalis G3]|eukprot:XP_001582782.1 hypothetical protein [Trichomonas vaginalis G3]